MNDLPIFSTPPAQPPTPPPATVSRRKLSVFIRVFIAAVVIGGAAWAGMWYFSQTKTQPRHSSAEPPLPAVAPDFSKDKLLEAAGYGNYAIFLVEKNGAQELWSAAAGEDDIQWQGIASEATMLRNSPIGFKNSVVFWISPDGNAISAFDLDSDFYFGKTIDPAFPDGNRLSFKSGEWESIYENNEFFFINAGTGARESSDFDSSVISRFRK